MANTRTSRSAETRSNSARDYKYTPPSEMEIPDDLEAKFKENGYSIRWIRFLINNEEDYKNIGKRSREGWEFVTYDEVKDAIPMSRELSTKNHKNLVTVGDLALAKIPTYKAEARKAYYEERAKEAVRAARQEAKKANDVRADKYTPTK